MLAAMHVRAFDPRDQPELERLARLMFPDADDPLGSHVTWFVIDRGDGRLGGYVEAGTRAYRRGLRHEPRRPRRGVVRRRGAAPPLIDNTTSIAAHRRLGFTEVERQVHFAKRLS